MTYTTKDNQVETPDCTKCFSHDTYFISTLPKFNHGKDMNCYGCINCNFGFTDADVISPHPIDSYNLIPKGNGFQ
jgi:hypothetical protein